MKLVVGLAKTTLAIIDGYKRDDIMMSISLLVVVESHILITTIDKMVVCSINLIRGIADRALIIDDTLTSRICNFITIGYQVINLPLRPPFSDRERSKRSLHISLLAWI